MATRRSTPAGQRSAVVVIGGEPPDPQLAGRVPDGADVICADSGLDHALALGLDPAVVIGDLDSVSAAGLERARRAGVAVLEHPCDKDATDTALALALAADRGYGRIVVLAGGGGRLDHALAALLALADPDLAEVGELEAWFGSTLVRVLHGPAETTVEAVRPGSTVSLLPLAGTAHQVTTTGLRWPLDGEDLPAGTTRGVSNELAGRTATVSVAAGVLAVVVPQEEAEQC